MRIRIPLALAACLSVVAALACTVNEGGDSGDAAGGGSITKVDGFDGATLVVGSKEFDEQLLLGQIAILAIEAAGGKATDKTNITGSDNVRKALTSGEIDLYWEYTGTAWISYLRKTGSDDDPATLYDAVKKADAANDITWWGLSPANNTYAIAANAKAAKDNNIKSISDYAALAKSDPSKAATCVGPEFGSRDDGLPKLQEAYGFTVAGVQLKQLNDAVVYPSVGKGEVCSFGSVAATDGRIKAQNLVLLEDDKKYFPIYSPAISIRSEDAEKYPGLEEVFDSIAKKLDSDTLIDLNGKVSVDGTDAKTVARDWLKEEGFIS